jgi:hypothetical protein
MTNSTTHQHRRRHLVAFVIAAAALPAILIGQPAAATDEPSEKPTLTPTEQAERLIAPDARPIAVADAYHGVGVTVCAANKRLVTVADAYHGVGVAVCV